MRQIKNFADSYTKASLVVDRKDSVYTTSLKIDDAIKTEIRKEGYDISFIAYYGYYDDIPSAAVSFASQLLKLEKGLADDYTVIKEDNKYYVEFEPFGLY